MMILKVRIMVMFLGGFGGRSVRKYSGGWKCSASWSERNCILKDPGEEISVNIFFLKRVDFAF